jgi:uncharacterized protein
MTDADGVEGERDRPDAPLDPGGPQARPAAPPSWDQGPAGAPIWDQRPAGPATATAAHAAVAAVPWTLVDAIGIIAVTAVTTVSVIFGVVVLALLQVPTQLLIPVLMPLPLILLGLVTVIWVQVRYRAARRLMGPRPARAREWLLGLGIGVGAFLAVNIGLGLLLQLLAAVAGVDVPQPQEGARDAIADPQLLPWLVLSAVLVAPVAEELFFRGLLFQSLRRRMRAWWAIAVSGVVFAAAHIFQELGGGAGPVAFILILPLGVLLGWLFERRGTLALPIAVHAAFNLVTVGILAVGMAVT